MSLIQQIQGVAYSFVFGVIISFIYCLINSYIIKIKQRIFKCVLYGVLGVGFGGAYYFGLMSINDGILRFYLFIAIMAGYLVYCNLYSDMMMIVIKKIHTLIKRVLSPCIFIFSKVSAIMLVTRRKIKWQKKVLKKHS